PSPLRPWQASPLALAWSLSWRRCPRFLLPRPSRWRPSGWRLVLPQPCWRSSPLPAWWSLVRRSSSKLLLPVFSPLWFPPELGGLRRACPARLLRLQSLSGSEDRPALSRQLWRQFRAVQVFSRQDCAIGRILDGFPEVRLPLRCFRGPAP